MFLRALLAFLLLSSVAFAQQEAVFSSDSTKVLKAPAFAVNNNNTNKVRKPKPIKKELSLGYRLGSDGWSVFSDYGRVRAIDAKHPDMFHNVLLYQLELTEKHDPKEQKIKIENNTSTFSSSYRYGKINNFYALKLGFGFRKMLAGKPDPGAVSIHWVNLGGFSLGMLKPYYLKMSSIAGGDVIKYTDLNKEDFLNEYNIEGKGGFAKGLDELQMIPGGHFKSALHFDYATAKNVVFAVEAGVNAEYYSQEVQLMASQPARAGFYNLFVSLQVGSRW